MRGRTRDLRIIGDIDVGLVGSIRPLVDQAFEGSAGSSANSPVAWDGCMWIAMATMRWNWTRARVFRILDT